MAITAKELAKILGLSPSAVSMALNNKPGVSTETRIKVLHAAREHGYDFSRISEKYQRNRVVEYVKCVKYGTVMENSVSVDYVSAGVASACKELNFKLNVSTCYDDTNFVQRMIEDLRLSRPAGLILLATDMSQATLQQFRDLSIPLVIMGCSTEEAFCDTVMFDNVSAALTATRYLIQKCQAQPGYLRSSYPVQNYGERADGFFQGIRQAGMSTSNSVVHWMSPTMEGALADMLNILEQGRPLARCYFADNDLIAAGAIKALRVQGYRVPEDISIMGFGDFPMAESLNLTTMHVSPHHMGMMSVAMLNERIRQPGSPFVKVRTSAALVVRGTVADK